MLIFGYTKYIRANHGKLWDAKERILVLTDRSGGHMGVEIGPDRSKIAALP